MARRPVYLAKLPTCDMYGCTQQARWDTPSVMGGRWGYACSECFERQFPLGNSHAQRLTDLKPVALIRKAKASAIYKAAGAGDLSELEFLVGDGDIADWI